jgi:exo-beta-1,3-glucanase (GH17 family)
MVHYLTIFLYVDGVIDMLSKRGLVSITLAAFAMLTLWHWWSLGQPVIIVDALTDRLSCVSYAPYHKPHQTPFEKTTYIESTQIESDLSALAHRFDCVRIYSVDQGLHEVPRIAQQLGIKVLLGMWIGRKHSDNEKELTRVVDLARKYPGTIRAIVVGNEVLLRGEQPASAIKAYIERVKSAVPGTQVTYADVWEFWLKNKDLADAVSFVTIHILPYWEDRPVSIDNAVGHVSHIYLRVKDEMKGKNVVIGETGWPSFGRQRQGAVPGLVNQARFIREFAVRANLEHIDYNVIEAFDQPWKRLSEGAVGGYWGLYDTADNAKFPFRGPVAEAPAWSHGAFAAMVLCFVSLVFLARRKLNADFALALLAVSIAGGGALTGVWREMVMTNRSPLEWAVTGLYAALLLAAVYLLGSPLAAWCSHGDPTPSLAPASHLVRWARRNDQTFNRMARLLGALRLAFLFGAAVVCLLLVFDSRYRDFPLALYATPALFLSLLSWINGKCHADVEEILLAGWIGFAGIWIAVFEHVVTPQHEPWGLAAGMNQQALAWALLCLLLSASVLGPVIIELNARQRQHTE